MKSVGRMPGPSFDMETGFLFHVDYKIMKKFIQECQIFRPARDKGQSSGVE